MSQFTIHGVAGSPYVRAVLMALEEKAADWRIVPLAGGGKSPEHLALHAFGRMPVLDDDDFRLYETQAIVRYLDRVIADPPLTPTDARAEAQMNQVCGITDAYVFKDISMGIAFQRLVAPRFGRPMDEAVVADSIPRAVVCVDELARLLGEAPFMAGESLSIADIMLAPHLSFLSQTEAGGPMLARQPRLVAWIQRMNARPSMAATTWEALAARAEAA